jgi:formate dehydrogenase subunit gamma
LEKRVMDFYYEYHTAILVIAVVLPLAVGAGHFLAIGPKGKDLATLPRKVQRFGLSHRLTHALRALSFILAGLTGYWLAFQTSTPTGATVPHVVLGRVFALASVVSMVFLFKPGLPRVYDRAWLRHFGGYLSRQPVRHRAGKYNAGQKIFIWLSLVLAIGLAVTGGLLEHSTGSDAWSGGLRVTHGLLAVSLIMLVIGHLYLSLVAVSGTLMAMIHGRVAEEWLAHHHPDDDSLPASSKRTEKGR